MSFHLQKITPIKYIGLFIMNHVYKIIHLEYLISIPRIINFNQEYKFLIKKIRLYIVESLSGYNAYHRGS